MTHRKSNWLAAACMAAMCCSGALAQDSSLPGIVRISDGRAQTQAQPASFHGHYGMAGQPCNGGCPTGGCPTGNCQNGCPWGSGWCGKGVCPWGSGWGCKGGGCPWGCQGGCCWGMQSPCCHGFFQERYCKNSPDHGYSPPAKYPLQRRGVQYCSYFPPNYYGTPGAVYAPGPVVYQPTDTTQLGFTYQHVPFWQPVPNPLPQRPIPAQWHIVAPPYYASSFHNGYGYGGYGGYGYGNACPASPTQSTTPSTGSPTTAPEGPPPTPIPMPTDAKPEASVPPAPRQYENSAASGHIRRAIY